MPRYKMLVFSEPVDGQDDDYNAWYTGRHLDDLCALPGFTAAQRFKEHSVPMGESLKRYLAIYEIEHDDPDWVIENMLSKQDTDEMPISPAINLDGVSVIVYEEICDRVTEKQGQKESAASV